VQDKIHHQLKLERQSVHQLEQSILTGRRLTDNDIDNIVYQSKKATQYYLSVRKYLANTAWNLAKIFRCRKN